MPQVCHTHILFLEVCHCPWITIIHVFPSISFFFSYPDFSAVIQAYVDAVLDLASHFITRLRRYASFCRTLASHAVTAGSGSNRNMVASPTQSSGSPATSQGQYAFALL